MNAQIWTMVAIAAAGAGIHGLIAVSSVRVLVGLHEERLKTLGERSHNQANAIQVHEARIVNLEKDMEAVVVKAGELEIKVIRMTAGGTRGTRSN